MESNYNNNDNFERFLRESSNQYRMYPSESVWKNVYNALHTRRRWFGIGLILLLSAGFVTTIMLTNSATSRPDQIAEKTSATNKIAIGKVEQKDTQKDLLIPYSTNYTQKQKVGFLETTVVNSADNLTDNTITEFTSAIFRNEQHPVEEVPAVEKSNIINTNTSELIADADVSTEDVSYTPLPIFISDPITDQDAWISRKTNFHNTENLVKRNQYKVKDINRPLTIESVINSYARKNKKISFQFYFTPTISYRKLTENKSYLRSNSPSNYAAFYNNINNAVTHKPDMGIELGVAAKYALNKNLKIRGGLQFNTSRYDIKAYSYAAEVTTIALNTGSYTVDSVNAISSYRNFNGYKSDWLHNFYFQVSVPLGIELKLAGDDKIQIGIATTIQPTYILGDRAYLLSSNYKNYAEVPWLIRRWNMNASFETFVSYSTGKMNWQVGPQVRYQLQSSFIKEYPVKEHLFDFGLKIGVSANK